MRWQGARAIARLYYSGYVSPEELLSLAQSLAQGQHAKFAYGSLHATAFWTQQQLELGALTAWRPAEQHHSADAVPACRARRALRQSQGPARL